MAPLPRLLVLLGFGMLTSAFTSSCLTPSASYTGGDGDGDSSSGGDGDGDLSGDGDGDNPMGGGPGGDGDGDLSTDHCTNRMVDADETDTDCGGQDCDPCELGRSCEANVDCVNDSCTMGLCQMPSCTDDVKNSSETDVDCGGTGCPPCRDDRRCVQNADCQSKNCDGGTCAAPTCSDRILNGDESDRDCGGDCNPCDSGRMCVIDGDCIQPDVDVAGVTTCDDGICAVTCGPGLGDCNGRAADGCETNINTDLNHCGACDSLCDPDHAVGRCEAGMCGIDSDAPDGGCLGAWEDCNSDPVDGCEANLNNDPDNCGACATDDPTAICSNAGGTSDCSSGICSIACDDGYDDCDDDARNNGCEADLNASVLNCGSCGNTCTPNSGESASCDTSLSGDPCVSISCDAPTDCNGFQPCGACNNAMCDDRLNSVANCGGCGIACTVSNGTPSCEDAGGGTFQCGVLTCNSGGGAVWNDCDDTYQNGCEVNTQSSKFKCGGCLASDPNAGSGEDCTQIESNASLHVTATQCSAGGCKIVSCATGYADCNGIFSDGCEVNTVNSGNHCGGCTSGPTTAWDGGFVCDSLYENGSGACINSTCTFDDCDTDYGDCNGDANLGDAGDGCEEYLVGNDDHCGLCGNACMTNARTSGNVCTAANNRACNPTCQNPTSDGNCDSNGSNGCETNLLTSNTNCGTCGNSCNASISTNSITGVDCDTGSCEVLTCGAGRADCNGTFGDGCEINTTNSSSHCGGCTTGPTTTWDGGNNCSSAVNTNSITAVSCTSSACRVTACAAGRADCDGTFNNGCEINTNTSATHCGGCTSGPTTTWDGGTTCATKTNATATCVSGGCTWTCNEGWKDTNGDLNNTSSNGCETAILSVVNHYIPAEADVSRANNGMDFTYTLQTSRASNGRRGLILILGNNSNPTPLPGAGDDTRINGVTLGSGRRINFGWYNQSSIHLYYILDANLPSAATSVDIEVGDSNEGMKWTAHVIEVKNLDQSAPVGYTALQGNGGGSCNGSANLNVTTNTDALVISALNTQGDDTLSALTSSTNGFGLPTDLGEALYSGSDTIAGYWEQVPAGTFNARWNCNDSEWTHIMASFNPEGTD